MFLELYKIEVYSFQKILRPAPSLQLKMYNFAAYKKSNATDHQYHFNGSSD
jgi:hypothetical protein